MKCPACDVPLAMSDRQGIEIDYCPQCRGVWLDRGELDKIIERSHAAEAPARPGAPPQQYGYPPPQQGYPPQQQHGYSSDYHKHKKKKGLLDDLFDF